ncbi:MAG: DUF3108 domain-containing protein [Bdellovibrio sp.]|nr:DUF3108 domain-containing protein [Bdellovibrio sp.]
MRLLVLVIFLTSCSSGILKFKGDKSIAKNNDFEQKVLIKGDVVKPEDDPELTPSEVATDKKDKTTDTVKAPNSQVTKDTPKEAVDKSASTAKAEPVSAKAVVKPIHQSKVKIKAASAKNKKAVEPVAAPPAPVSTVRQPDVEDAEGFEAGSRRPKSDPFQVGEVVTHSVRYFAAEAGIVNFRVKPYVEVNSKRSYNFLIDLKTSGVFSKFYSVDDQVETFLDYDDLVPYVFKLHLKESKQLKEAQSFFDQKTLKATYWENKYTEKDGQEDKKLEWEILPFSQNAFSGIFYMRIFKWDIGKTYSFRVSDDEKNIIFKGTALKKEKISTDAGEFNAIQIKAQIVSRGMLEQAGDILIWISDDEHKYILRIEAKIKIGTLVSEVTSIRPGKAN